MFEYGNYMFSFLIIENKLCHVFKIILMATLNRQHQIFIFILNGY